jgi:hypothetical protein
MLYQLLSGSYFIEGTDEGEQDGQEET